MTLEHIEQVFRNTLDQIDEDAVLVHTDDMLGILRLLADQDRRLWDMGRDVIRAKARRRELRMETPAAPGPAGEA